MHNTASLGRLLGWVSIALGVIALLLALLVESPEVARADFERCLSQIRLGLRQAPCPPPTGIFTVPALLGGGIATIASGVFFLLLSGILATLLDIRDDQRAQSRAAGRDAGRTAWTQRTARLPPDPAANEPAPRRALPTRFDMQQRHGERLGNAAWALMDKGLREGQPISEADAVQEARSSMQAQHG
jgi:hypothetical protein